MIHDGFERVFGRNAWAEEFGSHDSMESENKMREKVGRSPKGAAEGSC